MTSRFSSKISVRLEGGLGDCLLGSRFVPAIKEKYPNSEITAYIDSEGKTFQKEAIQYSYPSLFREIKVIQKKKYKEFWVDCQFGTDNYYGALENVPDDVRAEMESYDKFYDLHVDSLKWTNYDFDWLRYFKFFPRPEIKKNEQSEDYALFHLLSATSVGHRLEKWYSTRLIKEVSEKIKVIIISTPDTNDYYSEVKDLPNVQLFNGSVEEAINLIANAKIMISTDSGFRYLAHGFSIPVLTFSKHSPQPHSVLPSHHIRWLLFPETCFPLNFDLVCVRNIVFNALQNPGSILVPFLKEFNLQAVRRIYTINEQKSILNS